MKQKTLLFTILGSFTFLILQSSASGPVLDGAGNHTGSAGSSASCSGGGCHAANNSLTTAQVAITDTASTTALTSYTPGKKYYLRVIGGSATLSKFGFQASTVLTNNAQAGTLAVGGSSTANTAVRTTSGLQIFEHSATLSASVVAGLQVYGANCYWTAPAAGAGSVKVYAVVNGVNGNSTSSGDAPNAAAVVTLTEASSNVPVTTNNVEFRVYPNPATSVINVNAEGISNGTCAVSVYDMRGKLLSTEAIDAVNGSLNTTINSSKWAAGLYFVQITKDNQQKVIAVEKL